MDKQTIRRNAANNLLDSIRFDRETYYFDLYEKHLADLADARKWKLKEILQEVITEPISYGRYTFPKSIFKWVTPEMIGKLSAELSLSKYPSLHPSEVCKLGTITNGDYENFIGEELVIKSANCKEMIRLGMITPAMLSTIVGMDIDYDIPDIDLSSDKPNINTVHFYTSEHMNELKRLGIEEDD